jgi:hypothetical protein
VGRRGGAAVLGVLVWGLMGRPRETYRPSSREICKVRLAQGAAGLSRAFSLLGLLIAVAGAALFGSGARTTF